MKILDDELLTDEGKLNLESAFCGEKVRKGNEGIYKQYCRYSDKKHHNLRGIFLRRVLAKFMAVAEAGDSLGTVDGCFNGATEPQG